MLRVSDHRLISLLEKQTQIHEDYEDGRMFNFLFFSRHLIFKMIIAHFFLIIKVMHAQLTVKKQNKTDNTESEKHINLSFRA